MAGIKLGRIYLCKKKDVSCFVDMLNYPCKVIRLCPRLGRPQARYEVQFFNGFRAYLNEDEFIPTKLKETFDHAYREGVDD